MTTPEQSRYQEISRRAFLRRSAALGLAVAVPSSILASCGSDAATFDSGSVDSTTAPDPTTTVGPAGATTTTTEAVAPSTTGAEATASPTPAGTELIVDFTYAAASTSGVKNPYVAVWVEDEAGELAATIALWFLQSQKGTRWLSDLRRWTTVDGSDATIDVISSATRRPGSYTVVWDGTDIDGNPVPPGNYYIAIEAARENGPYSLIREEITIGEEAFSRNLESEGELSGATVALVLT